MRILIAQLKLHGFLTFSSTVGFSAIGGVSYTVYKPQPYIHNYALMYGFAGLPYVSLASPTNPENPGELNFSFLQELEKKIYVYPARPRHIVVKRMLCNIKGEGYAEPITPHPKSMYPWHVAHIYFSPGSVFETVIVVKDDSIRLPSVIRIGVKRQGVFKVDYINAEVGKEFVSGISDPVNLGDMEKLGFKPDSYILVLASKSRRVGWPQSNYIVKGFYKENKLAVIKGKAEGETILFRLPVPWLQHAH